MKNDIYGVIIPYNFSITEKSNLKKLKDLYKKVCPRGYKQSHNFNSFCNSPNKERRYIYINNDMFFPDSCTVKSYERIKASGEYFTDDDNVCYCIGEME